MDGRTQSGGLRAGVGRAGAWVRDVVVRKHRPDYQILVYTVILMMIGLIVIYAIGPQRAQVLNNAYGGSYSDSYFFIKQLVSFGLALAIFWGLSVLPRNVVLKYGSWVMILGFAACLFLAIAALAHLGVAECSLGACRWFDLGFLGSFQPAELLKFGLLLYIASFLGIKVGAGELNDVKKTLLPLGLIVGVALLFIVVVQKDMGTGISLMLIVIAELFVSGIKAKILWIILGLALILGLIFAFSAPHRVDRIMTFLKGDSASSSSSDDDYHIEQAKIAIGSGGLFGLGVGNSIESTGYLPEAVNDSVFAVIGEIFGFVGLVVVIVLFVALLWRLNKVIEGLIDLRLKLLVAGVFAWFGGHVILNIAAMTGIFPLTGITLPLLSSGGTSIIFMMAGLGIVFGLSKWTSHQMTRKERSDEDSSSRRRLGRSRHTSRSGF